MLFSQNFSWRHQCCLKLIVDRLRGSQCRHHGFAAAHIALQQPLHGIGGGQIHAYFFQHALLRRRQRKRECLQQLRGEFARFGKYRRALLATRDLRALHGQLLCEQLIEFHPYPGRVRALNQRIVINVRWRMMKQFDCLVERHEFEFFAQRIRQRVAGIDTGHCGIDGLAQQRLRQAFAGWIDWRECFGQWGVDIHRAHRRMHHLQTKEALAHFAAYAQSLANGHLSGLTAVEIQESQRELLGVVGERDHQLTAWAVLHIAGGDHTFDLHRASIHAGSITHGIALRLVFVAHGQVQRQCHIRGQPKPCQAVGGTQAFRWAAFFSGG